MWSDAGIAEQVHAVALAAYDRIIGLELGDIARMDVSPRRRVVETKPARRRWTGAKVD